MALLAGFRDGETRVRDQPVMGIMNRGQADQPIITALLSIRSSDDDQRLRERADWASSDMNPRRAMTQSQRWLS
jgi:hypothetical protein